METNEKEREKELNPLDGGGSTPKDPLPDPPPNVDKVKGKQGKQGGGSTPKDPLPDPPPATK